MTNIANLQAAREALANGQRETARKQLMAVVRIDLANGEAWHLLGLAVDDPAQRAECAARAAAAGYVAAAQASPHMPPAAGAPTQAAPSVPAWTPAPYQPPTAPAQTLPSAPTWTPPAHQPPPAAPARKPAAPWIALALLLALGIATGSFFLLRDPGGGESVQGPTPIPPTRVPPAPVSDADLRSKTRIAFSAASNTADGERDIYAAQGLNGSAPKRLTFMPGLETAPAWSPDGSQIAFVGTQYSRDPRACASGFVQEQGCNFDIFVMDADGGNLRRVTESPGMDRSPAWFPDGKRLIFEKWGEDGPAQIATINIDGTDEQLLAPSAQSQTAPAVSPDGTSVAYMQTVGRRYEIFVMNADGSDSQRLTSSGQENAVGPAWSPDGSQIAYVRVAAGTRSGVLHRMRADGSADHATDAPALPYPPTWSPDGRYLVVTAEGLYLAKAAEDTSAIIVLMYNDMFNNPTAPNWSPVLRP